jgi:hypothetical protein
MPNGEAVDLQTFPGLSQVGETGLLDQVNRHYGQIFGVSLAIGAIAGLSQAGTSYGGGSGAPAGDVYRQGVANSLSQTSLSILDRFLNVAQFIERGQIDNRLRPLDAVLEPIEAVVAAGHCPAAVAGIGQKVDCAVDRIGLV